MKPDGERAMIEFRPEKDRPNWINVLVDDVAKGWINKEGVIWRVTLWHNQRELDFAQGYGSLETAQRKVREHYADEWPEILEVKQ